MYPIEVAKLVDIATRVSRRAARRYTSRRWLLQDWIEDAVSEAVTGMLAALQNEPVVLSAEQLTAVAKRTADRYLRRVSRASKTFSICEIAEPPDLRSAREDICDRVATAEEDARFILAIQNLPQNERTALIPSEGSDVDDCPAARNILSPHFESRTVANDRRRARYYLRQVLGASA